MLYVSLILISVGIFFIIYTLFLWTEKETIISESGYISEEGDIRFNEEDTKASEKTADLPDWDKEGSQFDAIDDLYDHDRFSIEHLDLEIDDFGLRNKFGDEGERSGDREIFIKDKESKDEVFQNVEMKDNDNVNNVIIDIEDPTKTSTEKSSDEDNNSSAILYEDSSGIMDYDNSTSVIDTTLNGYKKIKRIGIGKMEIMREGISFAQGKKTYRFEFHRINTIKSGNNYVAVSLKGSNVIRLFLFKKVSMIGTKLKHLYNNYATKTV